MKHTKYDFNIELKKIENMHVPIKKWMMPIMHFFLSLLYTNQRSSKDIKVTKLKTKSYDNKNIKFMIYTPQNKKLYDKCLYFIHGGGFAFNSSPHHYKLAKIIANKLECKCIYVNYRLAPKYKYPVAHLDCYYVYKWILDNAKDLNIDPHKIIIMGDSAGGNLAASTTIRAHDNNLIVPNVQILLYPVLTYGIETESRKKYIDTPMCNSKDAKIYDEMFFKGSKVKEDIKYAAPYLGDIFEGYPKTYIEVAEYDCLHDDGLLFFNKLKGNNVIVEYHEVKKAMHGYDYVIDSNLVKGLIEQRIDFINKNI